MGVWRTKTWLLVALCASAACAETVVPPPPTLLTIDSIEVRDSSPPGYFVGIGQQIHVAFDVGPDRVVARLTPRFGETFVLHGHLEDDRLVLVPDGEFRAASNGSNILWIDRLELQAERVSDSQAAFGSRVVFSGREESWNVDVGGHREIEGEGTLGEDTTPPNVALESHLVEDGSGPLRVVSTPGGGSLLLPWGPIVLGFSEPVRPRDVHDALRVVSGSGHPQRFRTAASEEPVLVMELEPETWWESTATMTVEVASFEDLAGNASEPATVNVWAADFEAGTAYTETDVPVEAGCSATDDCLAFTGGGCDAGGAIVRTGPAPSVRVLAPWSSVPSTQLDIFQAERAGGPPTHHRLETPSETDTGWLSLELSSSAPHVLAIEVPAFYCWSRYGDVVPATIVVRR
jgi:hypothetical protein